MKNTILRITLFSILFTVLLNSCRKPSADETPCPVPFDPCAGKHTTRADFTIEENVGGRWFEVDSVWGYDMVRFTAKYDADSFIWKIGAETLYTKSIQRNNYPYNTFIEVTLICKRKNPDKTCFPNDDGRDTVTKRFYSFPQETDSVPATYYAIYGTYQGYLDSKPGQLMNISLLDTFIHFKKNMPYVDQNINARVNILRNFPYPNFSTENVAYLTDGVFIPDAAPQVVKIYSDIAMGGSLSTYNKTFTAIKGYAWLNTKNKKEITIEYQYKDTLSQQWISDKFKGTLIHH